jgi:phosphomannomutase
MRAIPTLKISISGVRGVVGESLTPGLLVRFAQAFGTYTGTGTIVIGRDTRTSGEMVRQAVVAGLLSSGCRVIDLDICPVPTVQLLVRERRARGGIAITASHNPAEWNALKFINSGGLFLADAQARQLLDIYHQGEYRKVAGAEIRSVEQSAGALDLHIKVILDALGALPLAPRGGRKLRVAVDSCNGAGSIVAPRLLAALGVEVVPVTVGEEYTLVLATRYVLGRERGAVVANLSTTSVLDAVAGSFGCPIYRSKIGEANVAEEMVRRQAVIGGEGNGGVMYPRINFARDSLVGMALVLHLLAGTGQTISELMAELPRSFMRKEKLACRSDKIRAVLRMVREEYARWPMDLRDGVRVTTPDGWFLVRGSNTEPIIRIVVESDTDEGARRLIEDLRARVGACLDAPGNDIRESRKLER